MIHYVPFGSFRNRDDFVSLRNGKSEEQTKSEGIQKTVEFRKRYGSEVEYRNHRAVIAERVENVRPDGIEFVNDVHSPFSKIHGHQHEFPPHHLQSPDYARAVGDGKNSFLTSVEQRTRDGVVEYVIVPVVLKKLANDVLAIYGNAGLVVEIDRVANYGDFHSYCLVRIPIMNGVTATPAQNRLFPPTRMRLTAMKPRLIA